jgi:hypothetical protein
VRIERRQSRRVARTVLVLGIAGLLAVWIAVMLGRGQREIEPKTATAEATGEAAEQKGVFRTEEGEVAIHLEGSTQRLIGLQSVALPATTLRPEVTAYGVLQEDPSRAFVVRAPIAGVVRAPEGGHWPNLGAVLSGGAVIGAIEPRVAPVERIDLVSRLATARADVASITASLAAARAALDRARTLNADGKIVSDRVRQEAEARVAAEAARLQAATEGERLIGASLKAVAGPTGPKPLLVDRGGTVIDILAQPGESIESGQAILRVAQFDTLLAKVVVPSGAPVSSDVGAARLIVMGHEDHPLAGESVALVAVDPKTQGQTFLVRLQADGFAVRPGQAVTAYLTAPGEPLSGVVIPPEAIVRYAGKAWVYVQTERETFVQREVATDRPVETGWFVGAGFKPGERVVTTAAQTVLSEELKAQIPSAEAGESKEQQEQEARERQK